MYIDITNEFEVQRRSSESSSDNEIIKKCVESGLEEDPHARPLTPKPTKYPQLGSPTMGNVESDTQLNTESNLQL